MERRVKLLLFHQVFKMFDYLEKLRQKPEKTRKRISLLFSLLFVSIIFLIWVTAIYPSFREEKKINDKIANIEVSPFSTFGNLFSESVSSISDQVQKIKEVSSNFFGKTDNVDKSLVNTSSTTKENSVNLSNFENISTTTSTTTIQ